ncbi:phospholipase-like protein [Tanacetum coccineum]
MHCPCDLRRIRIAENMMCEMDIDSLIIEQYLMLTEGNQAPGMDKYESLDEDTDFVSEDESEMGEQEVGNDIEIDKPLAPRPRHVNEKLGPEEDLDEWLKTEMEKRMCRQDKESEEDALIDILKSLMEECKVVYKEASSGGTNEVQGVSFVEDDEEGNTSGALPCRLPPKELNPVSFTLPCIIGVFNLYAMADLGASVNVMPKSIFEHLKLASLKETSMVVEMADMTKKAPLGIVENILVKLDKFIFPSDFIIIDMLGEPNETMILGRLLLATTHAQIDVFKREISLGIGEDRVKFDMDGGISHSRIPVEKIYMASSVHDEDYFNPFEIENDVFSYESPTCFYLSNAPNLVIKNIDTLDSAGSIKGLKDNHEDVVRTPNLERIVARWHACKPFRWIRCYLWKRENGMLEQWMYFWDHERQSVRGNRMICDDFLKSVRNAVHNEWVLDSFDVETDYGKTRDDPYSRRFDEYNEVFDNEIEQLGNEYDLRIGKKGYALDDVWEKCEKFSQQGTGIRGLLDSFSCGKKVLSGRNHLGKDWEDKKKQKRSKIDKKREKDKESRARARISQRSQPDQPDTVKERNKESQSPKIKSKGH